jgi:hypothetical protein|tara:strand:+ start:4729 stop:4962 length:234 start_codon:yes stop_codon:yes gene_type:complete
MSTENKRSPMYTLQQIKETWNTVYGEDMTLEYEGFIVALQNLENESDDSELKKTIEQLENDMLSNTNRFCINGNCED